MNFSLVKILNIHFLFHFQSVYMYVITFYVNFKENFTKLDLTYRISSYKALPRIIAATLIMPAVGTLLCRWNLVISNNTRTWRPNKKLIPAGLIWGNTVCNYTLIFMRQIYYFDTWAIIWHGIVCWFMVFPHFYQFLFVAILKLFCTDLKIKTKTI